MFSFHAKILRNVEAMSALFIDSLSTSIVRENIGTFLGYDSTIRLDCNLIHLFLRSCKPLIFSVRVNERFNSSLMLDLVIQGFFMMTTYHVRECSHT